jgi:hypothetical protein
MDETSHVAPDVVWQLHLDLPVEDEARLCWVRAVLPSAATGPIGPEAIDVWLAQFPDSSLAPRAVAHAHLRQVLASCLGRAGEAITLNRDRYGKPCLAVEDADLQFNLSHCGHWAVVAVTRGRPVGIDIEDPAERRSLLWRAIARRNFEPGQAAVLCARAEDDGLAMFLAEWTRREAILKAHGIGLRARLDTVPASAALAGRCRFDGSDWRWIGLRPPGGAFVTLAFLLSAMTPCG